MCCLKYEQSNYEELAKQVPPPESIVETPEGRGTVTETMLLKKQIRVRLDKQPDSPPELFDADKCKVITLARIKYDKNPDYIEE